MVNKIEIIRRELAKVKRIGKKPYEVAEHQQFVNRAGELVRVVRGSPKPIPVGEAYAFFDCNALKTRLEQAMPYIREDAQTPNELELYLMEGRELLTKGGQLGQIARDAEEQGIKYVMKANYPNQSNRETAMELGDVLNIIYPSSLYQQGEKFRGAIYYKHGEKYVSRR